MQARHGHVLSCYSFTLQDMSKAEGCTCKAGLAMSHHAEGNLYWACSCLKYASLFLTGVCIACGGHGSQT